MPIGVQLGKVMKLGKLLVSFSESPVPTLYDGDGLSEWNVTFTVSALSQSP